MKNCAKRIGIGFLSLTIMMAPVTGVAGSGSQRVTRVAKTVMCATLLSAVIGAFLTPKPADVYNPDLEVTPRKEATLADTARVLNHQLAPFRQAEVFVGQFATDLSKVASGTKSVLKFQVGVVSYALEKTDFGKGVTHWQFWAEGIEASKKTAVEVENDLKKFIENQPVQTTIQAVSALFSNTLRAGYRVHILTTDALPAPTDKELTEASDTLTAALSRGLLAYGGFLVAGFGMRRLSFKRTSRLLSDLKYYLRSLQSHFEYFKYRAARMATPSKPPARSTPVSPTPQVSRPNPMDDVFRAVRNGGSSLDIQEASNRVLSSMGVDTRESDLRISRERLAQSIQQMRAQGVPGAGPIGQISFRENGDIIVTPELAGPHIAKMYQDLRDRGMMDDASHILMSAPLNSVLQVIRKEKLPNVNLETDKIYTFFGGRRVYPTREQVEYSFTGNGEQYAILRPEFR